MSTSPLHGDLMAANNRQVRLFTTVGIYEGRLSIHFAGDHTFHHGQDIEKIELTGYRMPGQEGLYGQGVVFDPEAIKGIHPLAAPAVANALNL